MPIELEVNSGLPLAYTKRELANQKGSKMTDLEIESLLHFASTCDDRLTVALCEIALGLAVPEKFQGDLGLQVAAEIRAHGSARLSLAVQANDIKPHQYFN